jgi:hypothetical protein
VLELRGDQRVLVVATGFGTAGGQRSLARSCETGERAHVQPEVSGETWGSKVTDLDIQSLLLDCGFKSSAAPAAARWVVAGELSGDLLGTLTGDFKQGLALQVTCAGGARGGFVLLVPSEDGRRALEDLLHHNGVLGVDVRAERMEWRPPWLAVTVGVGALALFGWVVSSIHPFFP